MKKGRNIHLIYIKAVLERALEYSEAETPLDSILAVHNAHMALEWLLKYYSGKWKGYFNNAIDNAIKKAKEEKRLGLVDLLEKKREFLRRLNDLRNSAQHFATVSEMEVKEFVGEALDFTAKFFELVYGINYEEISFSMLLNTPHFKKLADNAEKALASGRYYEAYKMAVRLLLLILYGNEEMQGLVGLAGKLTGLFSGQKVLAKIINDTYPEHYHNGEIKILAKNVSQAFKELGMASTLMQFLDREEKARVLRLLNMLPEDENMPQHVARAWVHFAVMYAYRIETLGLAELMKKKK